MKRNQYPNIGIMLKVGERIRKIRGEMTQKGFAEALGIKQNAISRYESGRIPDDVTLNKIAALGGVTIDWLLRGGDHNGTGPKDFVPAVNAHMAKTPVEIALLAAVIATIEEVIKESRLRLDNYQKARLIARVYEECQTTVQQPSSKQVQKILLLVD